MCLQPVNAFKSFCEKTSKDSKCLPLPALLITPVQRIPRYRLLIQEYIKHTDKSHPDYPKLTKALDQIKDTATFINESVRMSQNREIILGLTKEFIRDPGFIHPSRVYVHEGKLTKKSRKQDTKYKFYLFNDMLAYAKKSGERYYSLHNKIPVDGTFEVRNVLTAKELHSFQIVNSVKSFQVFADSEEDKFQWLQALNSVVQTFKTSREILHAKDKKNCMAVFQTGRMKFCQRQRKKNGMPCSNKFGVFVQRHNCHKCGVLCCDACSPYKVFINSGDRKKHRVCTVCISTLVKDIPENRKLYKLKDLPPPESPTGTKMAKWTEAQVTSNTPSRTSISSRSRGNSHGSHARVALNSQSSLAGTEIMHGTVHISVFKGIDLRIKHARAPDPVVYLSLAGNTASTGVIRKSVSPEWNQDFRFVVEHIDHPLKIEVRDQGSIKKEIIGEASVDLLILLDGQYHEMEVKLARESVRSGILSIKMRFTRAMRKLKLRRARTNLPASTIRSPSGSIIDSPSRIRSQSPPGSPPLQSPKISPSLMRFHTAPQK